MFHTAFLRTGTTILQVFTPSIVASDPDFRSVLENHALTVASTIIFFIVIFTILHHHHRQLHTVPQTPRLRCCNLVP